MKFLLSLLIAFSLNSVSQDKGLDEIMEPDVQPAVDLPPLTSPVVMS